MIYDVKLLYKICVEEIWMNVCKYYGLYKDKDIFNGECYNFFDFNFENIKIINYLFIKICYYWKDKYK